MSTTLVDAGGAGGAAHVITGNYVAEVAALAIGDAVDYLRNLSTVSVAVQAVALEQFLETQQPIYIGVIQEAIAVVTQGVAFVESVGTVASALPTDWGS